MEEIMKYPTVAARFQLLLEGRNMTAKELSDRSGVGKSSISQYVNGVHRPSADKAGKIAKVWNVNPAWLMGYNVSAFVVDPEKEELMKKDNMHGMGELTLFYYRLNDFGKERLIAYAEKLYALQKDEEELQ